MNAPPFPVLLKVQDVSSPSARIVFLPHQKNQCIPFQKWELHLFPSHCLLTPRLLIWKGNNLSQIGTGTYVLGLEPIQIPAWDSNPRGQDLNAAKTLLGT